jgi:hypothetical protein
VNKAAQVRLSNWLSSQGAEVLMPTNPYELARFIAHGGTHIIYVNAKGKISANGFALQAMEAFNAGKKLDMGFAKTSRNDNSKRKAVLLKRDGRECFYCGKEMPDNDITAEHLIPLDKGGNNRLENMALCHQACNMKAGNLSLTKKVLLRDKLRGYVGVTK